MTKSITRTIDSYGLYLIDIVNPTNTQAGVEKCRSVRFLPRIVNVSDVGGVSTRVDLCNLVDSVKL